MSVLGVIPARYQSTRFEGKALARIGGRTMIERVYRCAEGARTLDRLVVATDDDRIAAEVLSFGGEVAMTSPDHPSGTDRVAEAATHTEAAIIVNIQGDEPFLRPQVIDQAVEPLLADESIEMSTLARPLPGEASVNDPNVVKVVVDREGFALYFSRAPIPFLRRHGRAGRLEHIGLYVYRRDFLLRFARLEPTPLEFTEGLEQLRALEHGHRIRVVETRDHAGLSVDTPEDLERAEEFWEKTSEERRERGDSPSGGQPRA